MDREFGRVLADCLAEIDGGASVDYCLKQHPAHATELRPNLEAWNALGPNALAQPSAAAVNRGRQAMQHALTSAPSGFGPLAAARMAPRWATVAAAVGALVMVLGGAAGTSAALGGPDVAGDALNAVGVTNGGDGDGNGGISHSSASERGLECANPNAFEGKENSEDKAQNAVDAKQKESCSRGDCEVDETDDEEDLEGEESPNGNGNAGANSNAGGNANANANANASGQGNAQPCVDDSDGDAGEDGSTDSSGGINNASENANTGKENANENAFEGAGNADDGSSNRNDNGNPAGGTDGAPAGPPDGQGQAGGQGQD